MRGHVFITSPLFLCKTYDLELLELTVASYCSNRRVLFSVSLCTVVCQPFLRIWSFDTPCLEVRLPTPKLTDMYFVILLLS